MEVKEGEDKPYFCSGAKIMVQLYDDRLEISNPGGLLPYVAADFGHRSRSRNPLIFRMFTRMHLVESVGTGIPRIARILYEDGFPPAEYKTEGFFTTTLWKKKTLMKESGAITTTELATALGINRSAVMRHIDTLKKECFPAWGGRYHQG